MLIKVGEERVRLVVMGSTQNIIQRCYKRLDFSSGQVLEMTAEDQRVHQELVNQEGEKNRRVVSQAYLELVGPVQSLEFYNSILEQSKDITLIGTYSLRDLVRPSIPSEIKELQKTGIRVLVASGDAKPTTVMVAQEAGII